MNYNIKTKRDEPFLGRAMGPVAIHSGPRNGNLRSTAVDNFLQLGNSR